MRSKTLTTPLLLAATLGASGALAGPFSLTGDFQFALEGGIAAPVNTSKQAIVVQNNAGVAPFAVTPLVGTDALNYGTPASFSARLSAGLENGARAFVRVDATEGSGARDVSALYTGAGAIPGSHDDGKLLRNTWTPVFTTTTSTRAYTVGYGASLGNGFSWGAGVIHADVAQDLHVTYDVRNPGALEYNVYGTSMNRMNGVDLTLAYRQAVSARFSVETEARVAGMANAYSYTYDYVDTGLTPSRITVGAKGVSAVVRSELSVRLAYALRENLQLTGRIGVVNYDNVGTGLENMLNPTNTATTVNPVTGSVRLPYVRIGVAYTF